MNSLFKKLNVLLQSQINNLVDNRDRQQDRQDRLTVKRLGKDIDGELSQLKKRVNEALAYEGQLQAKVDQLYASIADWDAKADAAVAEGRDEDARFAVRSLKESQRQLSFIESDLNEHRLITQELIQKVNIFEATVDSARQRQEQQAEVEAAESPVTSIDVVVESDEDDEESPEDALSAMLRTTREAVDDLVANAPDMSVDITPENPSEDDDDDEVDDDLDGRRSRLSKPKK